MSSKSLGVFIFIRLASAVSIGLSRLEGTYHLLSIGDFTFGRIRCASLAVSVVDAALIQGAEIVGRFQTAFPRFAIHEACGASVRVSKPKVGALRLINPFLPRRSTL